MKDEEAKTESVRVELESIREKHDQLSDEKFKVEEIVDQKVAAIERLQLELQRAREEVDTRKLVIDEMGKSMLFHEKESAEMAQKLSLMKNQIMENETGFGMEKRYGCVKKGFFGLKDQAVTVSNKIPLTIIIALLLDSIRQRKWSALHGHRLEEGNDSDKLREY